MPSLKTLLLFLVTILSAPCMAQAAASGAAANSELIDVASFFNGGYPYMHKEFNGGFNAIFLNQLEGISHGRPGSTFFRDDFNKREGPQEVTLFYSLAAPATIESFRVSGDDKEIDNTPHRIEFAISQTPDRDFQTVATFDVPKSYFAAERTQYDFHIPLKQKASGRYVRVTLSGAEYGRYRLSRFSAYGRFNHAVELRTDFSGVYRPSGGRNEDNPANREMAAQQKGTGQDPFLILHQQDGQITGCYVYGTTDGKSDSEGTLKEINAVLGNLTGGVENNVFRFTRTRTEDGSQNQGAMVLAPVEKGITNSPYAYVGRLLIIKNTSSGGKAGDGTLRIGLTRYLTTPPPCAVTGQKEKTAAEALQESLEKTGKAQLYGVNFDADTDVLRPESGAVLDEVVTLAKANPNWTLEIGAHTGSIGSADYNLKLSDRRAASVVSYLTSKGVNAAQLKSKGYGSTRPLIAGANNDAAHTQNRRVELIKQ